MAVDIKKSQMDNYELSQYKECSKYKKKCIGRLCSVTPFPEKCKYHKLIKL